MIKADEDALICDLAQTYQIFNYRSYPASFTATLAAGLPNDSRIKLKLMGQEHSLSDSLLALSVDYLSLIWWSKTEDGQKNRNRPQSVFDLITKGPKEKELIGFNSGEDFNEFWNKYVEGG